MMRRRPKIISLALRVRDPSDIAPSAASERARLFDDGWRFRFTPDGGIIPVSPNPYWLAGYMAANSAWEARYMIVDRA